MVFAIRYIQYIYVKVKLYWNFIWICQNWQIDHAQVGLELVPRDYDLDSPSPFKGSDIISMVPVYKVWFLNTSCKTQMFIIFGTLLIIVLCAIYSCSMLHAHLLMVARFWNPPRLPWTKENLKILSTMGPRFILYYYYYCYHHCCCFSF